MSSVRNCNQESSTRQLVLVGNPSYVSRIFSRQRFCVCNYVTHTFAVINHARYAMPQEATMMSRHICSFVPQFLLLRDSVRQTCSLLQLKFHTVRARDSLLRRPRFKDDFRVPPRTINIYRRYCILLKIISLH